MTRSSLPWGCLSMLLTSCFAVQLSEQSIRDEQHFEEIESYLAESPYDVKKNVMQLNSWYLEKLRQYSRLSEETMEVVVPDPPRVPEPEGYFKSLFKVSKKKLPEEQRVELVPREERHKALDSLASLRSFMITLGYMESLHLIREYSEFSVYNYELVQKLKARLAEEKTDFTRKNRHVDLIIEYYDRIISSPAWQISYTLHTKNSTLDRCKKRRVRRIVQDVCHGFDSSKTANIKNLKRWDTLELYERFIKPKSLVPIWNRSAARAALNALTDSSDVDDTKNPVPNIELIQRNLIEPCEYYISQLGPIFDSAQRVGTKPAYNSASFVNAFDNFFYASWTRIKVCKLLVQLGAQRILHDVEHKPAHQSEFVESW